MAASAASASAAAPVLPDWQGIEPEGLYVNYVVFTLLSNPSAVHPDPGFVHLLQYTMPGDEKRGSRICWINSAMFVEVRRWFPRVCVVCPQDYLTGAFAFVPKEDATISKTSSTKRNHRV